MKLRKFKMCSVHQLLLNCIIFFHLAPQLTLWSNDERIFKQHQNKHHNSLVDKTFNHLNYLNHFNQSVAHCKLVHKSLFKKSINFNLNHLINHKSQFTSLNLNQKSSSNQLIINQLISIQSSLFNFSILSFKSLISSAKVNLNKKWSTVVGVNCVSPDQRGGHRKFIN